MNKTILVLILANVVISLKGFSDSAFFQKYKFQVGPIKRGEQIRMISSGFLHVDYLHLFFNMYALYLFAGPVINNFGAVEFLIIYFASLLGGNLLSFKFNQNNSLYSAVGASGAVSGIIYAAIMLYPNMTLMMFPLPIPIPGYIFGVGYLLYSMYGMKKQLGNIGHSAHIGGAIAGFVLTLAFSPNLILLHPLMMAFLAIPIILLFIFRDKFNNL